ncbi:hypothetical protein D3C87_1737710 [compost metagenome]
MEEIVKGLNSPEVRERLRSCPSVIEGNNGRADSDMDLCGQALAERKKLFLAEGAKANKLKEALEKQEEAAKNLEKMAGKEKSSAQEKKASQQIQ